MNATETCLKLLQEKNWLELNKFLSNEAFCVELAIDPIFLVFEDNLVSEIQRSEDENSEDLSTVLARIFQLNQDLKILKLSEKCINQISEYLFKKNPSEKYAKKLGKNKEAIDFLSNKSKEREVEIEKTILAANINVKIGDSGKLDFSKSIFNSPQEKELYLAAKNLLKQEILLPNISLSCIINSKIIELLDNKTKNFFFKSTLDLCIVDGNTFKPNFFIELDSNWHDNPRQIENDIMKDEIFEKAGLKLHRLRKKENTTMIEIFEIYLKNNYVKEQNR